MDTSDTAFTTGNDVEDREDVTLSALDDRGAEDAFLARLTGGKQPTGTQQEGAETDAETGTSEHSEAEQHEADEAEGQEQSAAETRDAQPTLAGDDAIVEVKVGEETHRVPVKDLKRLFGQEAALTRRSQEVAEQRNVLLKDAERAKTVLQKALERAEAKAKPYAEADAWRLSRELDPDSFEQWRKDANERFEEVRFLREELGAVEKAATEAARASLQSEAQACVTALRDPQSPHHIEGWDEKLYGELLQFADAQGFKRFGVVTDPAAVKLVHMAYLYQRGKTVAQQKVKQATQQPRTPLRPGSAGGPTHRERETSGALKRLRDTGTTDAAEAVFMSRLRARDDDE